MTSPETSNQDEESSAEKARKKAGRERSNLAIMAWVVVVLTLILALLKPPGNTAIGWLFMAFALISAGCSWLGLTRTKRVAGGGRGRSLVTTLVLSLLLLLYGVKGTFEEKKRDQTFVNTRNEATLSMLEVMLERYHEKNKEFPVALTDLTEEAKMSPSATLETFLTYADPITEEKLPWRYERTAANECLLKSGPYQLNGAKRILALEGKDGEVSQVSVSAE